MCAASTLTLIGIVSVPCLCCNYYQYEVQQYTEFKLIRRRATHTAIIKYLWLLTYEQKCSMRSFLFEITKYTCISRSTNRLFNLREVK